MNRIDVAEYIEMLPIGVINQMRLERRCLIFKDKIKHVLKGKDLDESNYYPLVKNNRLYSNEELLKIYSGINEDLFAMIEHGLFFGKNHQKVARKHEYELGCIITGGEYRREIINEYFPDYYCETIGPMIHYTKPDVEYQATLASKLECGKTLLFFPAHGSDYYSPAYDAELTMKKIVQIAERYGCKNILICVFYSEMEVFRKIAHTINRNIHTVSCGNRYSIRFLAKQRAMIEASDITISNNLGTHLGFCVYLGKPHILLPQDFVYVGDEKIIAYEHGKDNRSDNWSWDFEEEKKLFQSLFNENCTSITKEQYDLCDYYWGFSKCKTPEQIRNIYRESKLRALEYTRR